MEKMDYSPVLKALKKADQDFTEENGITHYSQFDVALEKAAEAFNRENGTNFDPVEARHQYLELCEAQPNPFAILFPRSLHKKTGIISNQCAQCY